MTKKISKQLLEHIILEECILAEQELIVNELAEQYIQSLTEEQLQELTKANMVNTMGNIGKWIGQQATNQGKKALKYAKDKLSPLAKDAADIGKAAFAGAKDAYDRKRALSKYLKLATQLEPLQKRVDLILRQQARLAQLSPEVKNRVQQQVVGRIAELTGKETPGKTLENILAQLQASLELQASSEQGEQGEGEKANAEKEQATSAPNEPAQQATPKAPDKEQEVGDEDIVSQRSRPAFDMTDDGKKPARRRRVGKLEEEITEAVIQNILKLKDK